MGNELLHLTKHLTRELNTYRRIQKLDDYWEMPQLYEFDGEGGGVGLKRLVACTGKWHYDSFNGVWERVIRTKVARQYMWEVINHSEFVPKLRFNYRKFSIRPRR